MAKNFNIITYTLAGDDPAQDIVVLTVALESDFVVTPGVQPNVNNLILESDTFADLTDLLYRDGTLRFYFDTLPGGDANPLRWDGLRLVDVEILDYADVTRTPSRPSTVRKQAWRWRLCVADTRHRFREPRGGLLDAGEINKLPFDDETGKDANGNTLRNNKELADLCLAAMGAGISAPAGLTSSEAIKDVQWRGNHAPTELAQILDELGWAMIVKQGGGLEIVKIGDGNFEVPSNSPVVPGGMTIPNVDRRAKTVVFTSAPLPAANTIKITGLSDDAWRLVAQDKDGRWKTLDKLELLNGKAAADVVRNRFVDVDEEFREQARQQLYRYVALNPANYPGVRFFRELHVQGEPRTGMEFKGAIAVDQGNGTFAPAQTLARLTPRVLIAPNYAGNGGSSGSIVGFRERVGTTDGASADPEADFKELAAEDFEGRITIEAFVKEAADKPARPKYAFVGFTSDSTLSADAARAALSSPDTVCIRVPDLLLLQEEGSDTNHDELVQRCAAMADRYLANSGSGPRLHVFKGFAKLNLSGRVSEIRISQSPPLTKVKELTWWLPQSDYGRRVKEILKEDAKADKFPNQGKTEAMRLGQGVGGGAPPVAMLAAAEGAPPAAAVVTVKITAKAAGGGEYLGRMLSGGSKAKESTDLVMPAGQTIGTEDVLVCNLAENGLQTHWLNYPCYVKAILVGRTEKDAQGNSKAIAYTWASHPHVTFDVDLFKTGGSDGTKLAPPTYTYTVKSLSGDTLLTAASPLCRIANAYQAFEATRGLAYYDFEGRAKLLFAFEQLRTRQC